MAVATIQQESAINRYLAIFNGDLKVEKDYMLPLYQALAETFLMREATFTADHAPGAFLQEDVFDNTGQFAASLAASVLLSMTWPNSSRTFEIHPVRRLKNLPGVVEYFRFVTDEVRSAMDNPRAGLIVALMEHFLEQVIFGTSGVGAFEGPSDDPSLPVVYDAWAIKHMSISENAQGFVDTIYYERPRTVRQIVEEYANDNIPAEIIEAYNARRYEEKFKILHIIEPKKALAGTVGVAAMKYRTVHIDVSHKKIIREKGYNELPVFVARFYKVLDEVYARSPAMIALPDANSLNVLRENVLVASEKALDPPLGLLDDGRLGGGVVNTSSGSLNVFNTSGRIGNNDKPIFPLYTVGEMQSSKDLMEQLRESIMQAFLLDRLLDLGNNVQMTAFETSIRNKRQGESMGSIFGRQEMEVFTPLIERTFNILYRSGRLGAVPSTVPGIGPVISKVMRMWDQIIGSKDTIVPDAVAKAAREGLDVFEVVYISPAKRFQQAEMLQGILTTLGTISQMAPVLPGYVDNFDVDKIAEYVGKYAGAPDDISRSPEMKKSIREQMAQMQAVREKLAAAGQAADIAQKGAQAHATLQGAGGPK